MKGNFMAMKASPLAAAALLSTIVFGVFFVLRNYGPESTVRRFHLAAAQNNWPVMRAVSVGEDTSVVSLRSDLEAIFHDHASIGLGRVNDDDPNRVVAQFIYRTPDYTHTINWVVVHTRRGWLIDAGATVGYPFAPAARK